jgi:hypothetical protein
MKLQKPQEPQEFSWVTTKISEKNVHSGNKKDDKTSSEYIEIYIEDHYGNPLDFVKIEEYTHQKIQNLNYEKELEQYKKDLKIYKEYCAKISEKKKLAKAARDGIFKQLQNLDTATLQNIIQNLNKAD